MAVLHLCTCVCSSHHSLFALDVYKRQDVTGYQYESWHLRYVGKDIAKEIVKQGLTLDEYIARKDVQK